MQLFRNFFAKNLTRSAKLGLGSAVGSRFCAPRAHPPAPRVRYLRPRSLIFVASVVCGATIGCRMGEGPRSLIFFEVQFILNNYPHTLFQLSSATKKAPDRSAECSFAFVVLDVVISLFYAPRATGIIAIPQVVIFQGE